MADSQPDVTQLLAAWRQGEAGAFDRLLPLVYEELRVLAHRYLRRERADHTLNTTALVHEAYLNLVGKQTPWENRNHFFAVAAHAMRHILIDYARRRNREKRGGGVQNIPLDKAIVFSEDRMEDLLALDLALQQLEQKEQRLGRIVECRYFAGLTIAETAEALEISPATVKRDWLVAKAWLKKALQGGNSSAEEEG